MAKQTFVFYGEDIAPISVMIDILEEIMPKDLSREDLKKYISKNYNTIDLEMKDDFNDF